MCQFFVLSWMSWLVMVVMMVVVVVGWRFQAEHLHQTYPASRCDVSVSTCVLKQSKFVAVQQLRQRATRAALGGGWEHVLLQGRTACICRHSVP